MFSSSALRCSAHDALNDGNGGLPTGEKNKVENSDGGVLDQVGQIANANLCKNENEMSHKVDFFFCLKISNFYSNNNLFVQETLTVSTQSSISRRSISANGVGISVK